jgi:hypothetical protein
VRDGRRVATAEARLMQTGREIVRAVATFCDLDQAPGRTLTLADAPLRPSPEEAIKLVAGASIPGTSIIDRFDSASPSCQDRA